MHTYLDPSTKSTRIAALRSDGAEVFGLRRRGVHHGFVLVDDSGPAVPDDFAARWAAAQPILLREALTPYLEAAEPLLQDSLAMFDRLRQGDRFLDEVVQRMQTEEADDFTPAGSTFDRLEPREIEKVFVNVIGFAEGAEKRRLLAKDLWARLSWIASDETDLSLRIRFSCGVEQLDEWVGDDERARWADKFADCMFPECAMITENAPLEGGITQLVGDEIRFSERIIYANAPGGGAVFHHDADPGQLGVTYGQFVGKTGWLALAKRELAACLAERVAGTGMAELAPDVDAALAALDGTNERVWDLLNNDPAMTRLLVESGAFYPLHPGDVLLLPTLSPDDAAWHAVFCASKKNLAHSYGIFHATTPEDTP